MLQNDFQNGAGHLRPKPFSGHELLIRETHLNRATADIKTHNTIRSFANWFPKDLHDIGATRFEWFYSLPGRGLADPGKTKSQENDTNNYEGYARERMCHGKDANRTLLFCKGPEAF